MSKRQEATSLPDRLGAFARRFTLTHQEMALVAAILFSMLIGSLVMHYRREYRLHHPAIASPTPHRAAESSGEN